jgi:phosphatidylinositol alpha-mannosyltransferase
MVGAVPNAELHPYHAGASVYVAPATGHESFGMVLVEAMAAGVPVIASDIDGYREVVRDGVDGLLVDPRDTRALAGAVIALLRDPERRARMGAAGRERAAAFSEERMAREAWELAARVVAEPRARRPR